VLSYQQLKPNSRALRACTGLDQTEFEKLLTPFTIAYHAYRYNQYIAKRPHKRHYGGGRKPRLASMEDKLMFILFYFKIYPLQEVMAFLFDISQCRVNEWIRQLSTVLRMTLGKTQVYPKEIQKTLEKAKQSRT